MEAVGAGESWWELLVLDGWEGELREQLAGLEGLGATLRDIYQRGAEAWPDIELSPAELLGHLRRCIEGYPSKKGVADWFAHVQPEDLYLACGCLLQPERAVPQFERSYGKVIDAVVRRFHNAHVSEDDLRQILRERLFLDGPTRAAKLWSYSGQGFLENWLRVTAVRTFLDVTRTGRQQKREQIGHEEALLEAPDVGLDLELAFLKREYRSQFKEAFAVALGLLSSRERNLLYQHLVARLNIDQIGALYHIHRSTAARQLERAREALFAHTRSEMMKRLKVSAQEFDSIMVLIQSRLDVSVARLLGEEPPPEEGS